MELIFSIEKPSFIVPIWAVATERLTLSTPSIEVMPCLQFCRTLIGYPRALVECTCLVSARGDEPLRIRLLLLCYPVACCCCFIAAVVYVVSLFLLAAERVLPAGMSVDHFWC